MYSQSQSVQYNQYQQHQPSMPFVSQLSSPSTYSSDSLDSSTYSSSDSSLNQSYQGDMNTNLKLQPSALQMAQNDSSYFSRNNSYVEFGQSPQQAKRPDSLKYFSIEAILSMSPKQEVAQPISVPVQPVVNPRKSTKRKVKHEGDGSDKVSDSKRARTIFSQEQLSALEVEFDKQQYMVGTERTYLARSLGLTESQVKIWFQNRRIKWRKNVDGSVVSDDLE